MPKTARHQDNREYMRRRREAQQASGLRQVLLALPADLVAKVDGELDRHGLNRREELVRKILAEHFERHPDSEGGHAVSA